MNPPHHVDCFFSFKPWAYTLYSAAGTISPLAEANLPPFQIGDGHETMLISHFINS